MQSTEFHQASQFLIKHKDLFPPLLYESFSQVSQYLSRDKNDKNLAFFDGNLMKILETLPFDFIAFLLILEIKRLFPDIAIDVKMVEITREFYLKPQSSSSGRKCRFYLNFAHQKLRVFTENSLDYELGLNNFALRWIGKIQNEKFFGFSIDSFDFKAKNRSFLLFGENIEKIKDFYENIKLTINNIDYSGLFRTVEQNFKERGLRHSKTMVKSVRNSRNSNSPKPKRLVSLNFSENNLETIENKEPKRNFKSFTMKNPEELEKAMIIEDFSKKELNLNENTNDFLMKIKENENEISSNKNNSLLISKENQEKIPDFLKTLINDLRRQNLTETLEFDLLENENEVFIFQNKKDPYNFKIIIEKTSNFSQENICRFFLQPEKLRFLHKNLIKVKILNIISPETSIFYEIYKKYGLFYLPREFVFMTSFVRTEEGEFLIISKSVKYNETFSKFLKKKVRGDLKFSLIYITKERIVISIAMDQGGYLSNSQNKDLTMGYLRDFYNLKSELEKNPSLILELKTESLTSVKDLLIELKRKNSNSNQLEINAKSLEENKENPIEIKEKPIEINEKSLNFIEKPNNTQKADFNLLIEEEKKHEGARKKPLFVINPIETKDEDELFRKNRFLEKETELKIERYHSYDAVLNPEPSPEKRHPNIYLKFQTLLEEIHSKSFLQKSLQNLKPLNYTKQQFSKFIENSIEEGHFILKKDWLISPTGEGLIFINKKVLQTQKNMLSYLLKRLGSSILQGKPISSISFPIDLYEPLSELELNAKGLCLLPFYLEKAGKTLDSLERFKLTISGFIASLHLGVMQKKPFNSGIGETHQAIIDGCPIYFEQIKSDPSTSLFQMYGDGFNLSGYYETIANLNPNSCLCRNQGKCTVFFSDFKEKIQVFQPFITISGTAFGKRIFNFEGKMCFISQENHLFAEIAFNPDKKSLIGGLFSKQGRSQDSFSGSIYQIKPEFHAIFNKDSLNFIGITTKQEFIVNELAKVEGVWHKYIRIDEKKFWDFEDYKVFEVEKERFPLPSDSCFREDILLWRLGDRKAQIEMENRSDEEKKIEEMRKKARKNTKKLKKSQ